MIKLPKPLKYPLSPLSKDVLTSSIERIPQLPCLSFFPISQFFLRIFRYNFPLVILKLNRFLSIFFFGCKYCYWIFSLLRNLICWSYFCKSNSLVNWNFSRKMFRVVPKGNRLLSVAKYQWGLSIFGYRKLSFNRTRVAQGKPYLFKVCGGPSGSGRILAGAQRKGSLNCGRIKGLIRGKKFNMAPAIITEKYNGHGFQIPIRAF